ncbi:hypothetical protein M501DRAFT_997242 [Patellaria atrata CBS 101060]|uniref:SH3 domain-containing protein n=1 Tax=Patellaria atrata CBS 101060 TaxID=1346257 RepID=A0A9P4VK60_9PEZI|nr:hypothetical protein M501DRAFT_997242 [Patellaria atrata CBS 101060]
MASPPFKVKAVYEYNSPHEDDLSFPDGQIITVTEEEDADWYIGEYTDASGAPHSGLFPKNFVEKYEPAPPPRPTRAARPKQTEAPTAPVESTPEPVNREVAVNREPTPEPAKQEAQPVEPEPAKEETKSPVSPPVSSPPKAAKPVVTDPPSASKLTPGTKAPPPVAEKSSSFKDRIAAFNKTAAAPIAPFKPAGFSGGFIKKPFVAPPPSKDAYVPPPREPPPQKLYRRDEDPEIAERRAQDDEEAERAGLVGNNAPGDSEDTPKPTSLKERIALLQKQQMEQAARRAEGAHKEKPKKPPKKRTDSQGPKEIPDPEVPQAEKVEADEPAPRGSSEVIRETGRAPPTRRASHGPRSPEIRALDREPFSDANDADQSAAGETTEDAEGTSTSVDDEERPVNNTHTSAPRTHAAPAQEADVGDEEDSTEEEEDEMDAETRRRLELRERMAKMSGGMGMAGMFGPPGGMPLPGAAPKRKKQSTESKEVEQPATDSTPTQRIPMIPIPGMSHVQSPEHTEPIVEEEPEITPQVTGERPPEEVPDIEDVKPQPPTRNSTEERRVPVLPPQDRQAPLPPTSEGVPPPPVPGDRTSMSPTDSRPAPPPPTSTMAKSPTPGSESDDEMGEASHELPIRGMVLVTPSSVAPRIPIRPDHSGSPETPANKRNSYFGSDAASPGSQAVTSPSEKRASRPPPPIPTSPTMIPSSATVRPPPPPPPTHAPPSRQSTTDFSKGVSQGENEEETEYEGDYDTDIAPGATHKDALKAHARESSHDDSTIADDTPVRSPISQLPPPIPQMIAPRAFPPPPPTQAPPKRQSMETPRAAPPPIPHQKEVRLVEEGNDYDPYRYSGPPPVPRMAPPPPTAPVPSQGAHDSDDEDDLYSSPPPRPSVDRRPPPPPQTASHHERIAPPPPPHGYAPPPPPTGAPPNRAPPKQSLDVERHPPGGGRRSMDQPRPSSEHGYIARDIDLSSGNQWWAQTNTPPAPFQGRKDVLFEVEESSSTKRGGKTTISKDVYVLFQDYSQTIVTARFDAKDINDVSLEQRHEPPPAQLRQDQLEEAYSKFGRSIHQAVTSKQNTTVGDGTPQGLVQELFRPLTSALASVGTRAYGALVYANIANASVQQFDEIRPGDIITIRNAKFEGKHGAMHAKYKTDVGKPDHVGVVEEWDGTKKKVRAWEQGRESKKVKVESFKIGDLRSGEVKVWRVMSRSWVGWDDGN